jgi:misacylated tRNA(Ala) deacylase
MSRYYCHEHPDVLTLQTRTVDARPGAVVLQDSPFHPGGGGQLPDRGLVVRDGLAWASRGPEGRHGFAGASRASGGLGTRRGPHVDQSTELHTDTHILNALVYRHFAGALVTGAQLNDDGTARMDFDLPDADNDRLRALEPEINDAIRQDLPVRYAYVIDSHGGLEGPPNPQALGTPRQSRGAPRSPFGTLDRQACGGTHLPSTARSRPIRVLKIDNKGRHNRRVRLGLVD